MWLILNIITYYVKQKEDRWEHFQFKTFSMMTIAPCRWHGLWSLVQQFICVLATLLYPRQCRNAVNFATQCTAVRTLWHLKGFAASLIAWPMCALVFVCRTSFVSSCGGKGNPWIYSNALLCFRMGPPSCVSAYTLWDKQHQLEVQWKPAKLHRSVSSTPLQKERAG